MHIFFFFTFLFFRSNFIFYFRLLLNYFKHDFGVRTPILILYVIKVTILQYGMLISVLWDFIL